MLAKQIFRKDPRLSWSHVVHAKDQKCAPHIVKMFTLSRWSTLLCCFHLWRWIPEYYAPIFTWLYRKMRPDGVPILTCHVSWIMAEQTIPKFETVSCSQFCGRTLCLNMNLRSFAIQSNASIICNKQGIVGLGPFHSQGYKDHPPRCVPHILKLNSFVMGPRCTFVIWAFHLWDYLRSRWYNLKPDSRPN
jgi:hypothetical protein